MKTARPPTEAALLAEQPREHNERCKPENRDSKENKTEIDALHVLPPAANRASLVSLGALLFGGLSRDHPRHG